MSGIVIACPPDNAAMLQLIRFDANRYVIPLARPLQPGAARAASSTFTSFQETSMTPSNLHVVFGAGPLGRAVVNELIHHGKAVRVVSRKRPDGQGAAGRRAGRHQPLQRQRRAPARPGRGRGLPVRQPAYHRGREVPAPATAVIEGLTGSGVKLVIGENTYMVGNTQGKPLTEDLPHAAHTRKGKVRAAMSEAALAAHHAPARYTWPSGVR